jgi:hypothetical protein
MAAPSQYGVRLPKITDTANKQKVLKLMFVTMIEINIDGALKQVKEQLP